MAEHLLSTAAHRNMPGNYVRPEAQRPRLAEVVFQVLNHGIGDGLIAEVMAVAREFFRLPAEEKAKLYSDDPTSKIRLSITSFNVPKEMVHNWRDYLRLHCHPLDQFVPDWPSNPPDFKPPSTPVADHQARDHPDSCPTNTSPTGSPTSNPCVNSPCLGPTPPTISPSPTGSPTSNPWINPPCLGPTPPTISPSPAGSPTGKPCGNPPSSGSSRPTNTSPTGSPTSNPCVNPPSSGSTPPTISPSLAGSPTGNPCMRQAGNPPSSESSRPTNTSPAGSPTSNPCGNPPTLPSGIPGSPPPSRRSASKGALHLTFLLVLLAYISQVLVGILPESEGIVRDWSTAPTVLFSIALVLTIALLSIGVMAAGYYVAQRKAGNRIQQADLALRALDFSAKLGGILSSTLLVVASLCRLAGRRGCVVAIPSAAVIALIMWSRSGNGVMRWPPAGDALWVRAARGNLF